MPVVPKRKQPEKFVHLWFERLAWHSSQAADELQIFPPGKIWIKACLLRHITEAALKGREIIMDASPLIENLTL